MCVWVCLSGEDRGESHENDHGQEGRLHGHRIFGSVGFPVVNIWKWTQLWSWILCLELSEAHSKKRASALVYRPGWWSWKKRDESLRSPARDFFHAFAVQRRVLNATSGPFCCMQLCATQPAASTYKELGWAGVAAIALYWGSSCNSAVSSICSCHVARSFHGPHASSEEVLKKTRGGVLVRSGFSR